MADFQNVPFHISFHSNATTRLVFKKEQ